jgi:hypothetical protein
VVVTVSATAEASAGTLGGSGTVRISPGASGAPRGATRVSSARVGSIGTNRPAVAVLAGTNQPVTSRITGAGARLNTPMRPSAPTPTIVPLARTSPGAWLTTEVSDRIAPSGQMET